MEGNSIEEFNEYLRNHTPGIVKKDFGHYYNTVGAFDTETTEFESIDANGKKITVNYVYFWSFCLGGELFAWGRDPQEFVDFINKLNLGYRLIVYDHWLGYEYNNLRDMFDTQIAYPEFMVKNDFARVKGAPYKVLKLQGNIGNFRRIQFRCSSCLSGNRKLEELGEDIGCNKLELDYKKPRNRETPMTKEEIDYCLRDVEIVCKWVLNFKELLEVKDVKDLPYTMASSVDVAYDHEGYTRNVRRSIMQDKYVNWDDKDDDRFAAAYKGGEMTFNKQFLNKYTSNILYADIKSAYPAVMLMKEFPKCFSKEKQPEYKQKMMIENYEDYAVIAKFTFTNLSLKPQAPCSILRDKDHKEIEAKVVYTDYFTNVELQNIKKFYNFSSLVWEDFQWSQYEPLDYRMQQALVNLFIEKEEAKGTDEEETKKRRLNSAYGRQSRKFNRITVKWDNEAHDWVKDKEKTEVGNRVDYYPVGVWVAAWQRKIMLDIIWELGDDFIYSNTDSVICLDNERNRQIIEDYNNSIIPIGKDEDYAKLGKFEMEHFHEILIAGVSKYILKNEQNEVVKSVFSGVSAEITEEDLENYAAGGGFVIENAMPRYRCVTGNFKGEINGVKVKTKSSLVITHSDYAPTPDDNLETICYTKEIY